MRLLAWLLLLPACAAPRAASLTDGHPLVTAGPRCAGGACACREVDASGATRGDADEGVVPAGQKRFELRTGRGADEVHVTLDGRGTLDKGAELLDPSSGPACGYVDLPPGEHRVRWRVKAPPGHGAAPRLYIAEHGARTGSWYATFGLSCGTSAQCTRAELADRIAELQRARGILDPCGSVKVRGVHYDAAHDAEDRVTSLDLEFVLEVYRFEPRFPRGGTCKGLSGGAAGE